MRAKPAAFQNSAAAFPSEATENSGARDRATARASAVGTLRLPLGLPSATIRVECAAGPGAPDNAAPGVRAQGPKGLVITYASGASGIVAGIRNAVLPVGGQTFVKLMRPVAGVYRVEGIGGTPITAVAVAHGLPAPRVKGRVVRPRSGSGRVRVLHWQARPIAGQRIEFAEEAKGGLNTGRISVAGVTRGNVAGPAVKLRLKAKPKRLKPRAKKAKTKRGKARRR